MYGKRRFAKKSTTSRSSYRPRARPTYALKKMGATFARSVEKKYFDKTYQANNNETLAGSPPGTSFSNGITYISNAWGTYSFGGQAAATTISNDMLKGVETGTTARTRIGNKIKPNYLKGAFTFTSAAIINSASKPQGGETVANPTGSGQQNYLRTSYRFVIVKDLQVNSTDAQVTWQQVFDTTNQQAGIHSELNVDNMGRFIILEDKVFTVDADTPQKTLRYMIKGSKTGSVRYNGPTAAALTDKGIYVIYAAFVMGVADLALGDILLPSPVGHSRLCFSDE